MNKDFNYSYWEINQFFKTYDLIVVGAGIVSLSTAIAYKKKHKKAEILILERGVFPEGASTKNAGFACFGSAGELINDLASNKNQNEVWGTVKLRWEGLNLLRSRISDQSMAYKNYGGFELFTEDSKYQAAMEATSDFNKKIKEIVDLKNCYRPSSAVLKNFKGFKGALFNPYEGQLDVGKMMHELENLTRELGIRILYNIPVIRIEDDFEKVKIHSEHGSFRLSIVQYQQMDLLDNF